MKLGHAAAAASSDGGQQGFELPAAATAPRVHDTRRATDMREGSLVSGMQSSLPPAPAMPGPPEGVERLLKGHHHTTSSSSDSSRAAHSDHVAHPTGGGSFASLSSTLSLPFGASPPPINFGLLPISRSSSPSFLGGGTSAGSSHASASARHWASPYTYGLESTAGSTSDFHSWTPVEEMKSHRSGSTSGPTGGHHLHAHVASSLVLPPHSHGTRSPSPLAPNPRSLSPPSFNALRARRSSSNADVDPFAAAVMEDEESVRRRSYSGNSTSSMALSIGGFESPAPTAMASASVTTTTVTNAKKAPPPPAARRPSRTVRAPRWAASPAPEEEEEEEDSDEDDTDDDDDDDADSGVVSAGRVGHAALATAVAVAGRAVQAAVVASPVSASARGASKVSAAARVLPPGVVLATRIPPPPGAQVPQQAKVLTAVPQHGLGPPPKHVVAAAAAAAAASPSLGPTKKESRARAATAAAAATPVAAVSVAAPSPRARSRAVRGGSTSGRSAGSRAFGRAAAAGSSSRPESPALLSRQTSSPTIRGVVEPAGAPSPLFTARSPLKRPLEASYSPAYAAAAATGQVTPSLASVVSAVAVAATVSGTREAALVAHPVSGRVRDIPQLTRASSLGTRPGVGPPATAALAIPTKVRASSGAPSAYSVGSAPAFHAPRHPSSAHAPLSTSDHSHEFESKFDLGEPASPSGGVGPAHFSPPSPISPIPAHFGGADAQHGHGHGQSHNHGHVLNHFGGVFQGHGHGNLHTFHPSASISASGSSHPSSRVDDHFGSEFGGYHRGDHGGLLSSPDDGTISTDHFFQDDDGGGDSASTNAAGMPETPRTQALSEMMRDTTFQPSAWPRRADTENASGAFALQTPPPPTIPSLHSGGLLGRTLPLHSDVPTMRRAPPSAVAALTSSALPLHQKLHSPLFLSHDPPYAMDMLGEMDL